MLIAGFLFSMVIFAVIAVLGLAAWAYLWWKTREFRKTMAERSSDGHVIEGEAVVVEDPQSAQVASAQVPRQSKTDDLR